MLARNLALSLPLISNFSRIRQLLGRRGHRDVSFPLDGAGYAPGTGHAIRGRHWSTPYTSSSLACIISVRALSSRSFGEITTVLPISGSTLQALTDAFGKIADMGIFTALQRLLWCFSCTGTYFSKDYVLRQSRALSRREGATVRVIRICAQVPPALSAALSSSFAMSTPCPSGWPRVQGGLARHSHIRENGEVHRL